MRDKPDISGEAEPFLSVNKIHETLTVFSNTPGVHTIISKLCWRQGGLWLSDWVGRWGPIGPTIAMVDETLGTWVGVETMSISSWTVATQDRIPHKCKADRQVLATSKLWVVS